MVLHIPFSTNVSSSSLTARINEICKFPNETQSERIINGLRWFGLFSSDQAIVRGRNLLDTLCAQLEKKLSYQPGERDLVMLQHKFVIEWKNYRKVVRFQIRRLLVLMVEGNCHLYSRALWRSKGALGDG